MGRNRDEEEHTDQLRAWIAATDAALKALKAWRARLTAWNNGGGLVSRADLAEALDLLTDAGLDEWAAEAGDLDDLDDLAEMGDAEDDD